MLTERAVPVCIHLGLTPQSVNVFGGYKVQGREEAAAAEQLKQDAMALENRRSTTGCIRMRPRFRSKNYYRITQYSCYRHWCR